MLKAGDRDFRAIAKHWTPAALGWDTPSRVRIS